MWARVSGYPLTLLRGLGWGCSRLTSGSRNTSKAFSISSRHEGSRWWRRARLWGGAGGSLLLLGVHAARHAPARCLREGGFFLDPEDDQLMEASPMEMNEVAALTHTALLKQASGVAVDGAIQLLHRTLRATLDFSQQHRKQLHEVIELLEYCTTMLRHPEEHDRLWDLVVAARARVDSLKQQLRDLNLLMTYACSAVENTAMAAYISGGEFSASAARQITDSAKLELIVDERETEALEMQYTITHTHYIEAAQKMMDDAVTGDSDDNGDVEDAATEDGGVSESVEKSEGEEGRSTEGNSGEDDDR